jgi:hypothetical protein
MYKSSIIWEFDWKKRDNEYCELKIVIGNFLTFEEAYYFTVNCEILHEPRASNQMLIYVRNSAGIVEEKFTYEVNKENITVSRMKPESYQKWVRNQNDFKVVNRNEYKISDLPRRFGSLAYSILDDEGKPVEHDRSTYQHLVNPSRFEDDDDNIQPLSPEMRERAIQELENYIA